LRVHRRLLGHRLPPRPDEDRRADARHPRRRRPGRAVRSRRHGLLGADQGRPPDRVPVRAARHHRHPQGAARQRPARVPAGVRRRSTIVLVHGLWVTPRSWENWVPYYEAKGHTVLTPAYPGFEVEVEALREDPTPIAAVTVPETVAHLEKIIAA